MFAEIKSNSLSQKERAATAKKEKARGVKGQNFCI